MLTVKVSLMEVHCQSTEGIGSLTGAASRQKGCPESNGQLSFSKDHMLESGVNNKGVTII